MYDQLIQLGISLLAILLIVLLAKSYWPQKWLLDSDRVRRAFARSDYTFTPQEIWLDTTGSAALTLTNKEDTLGYAFVFGDRVTCRPLNAHDIKSVQSAGKKLTLKFMDYTLNSRCFTFSDENTCSAVKGAINRLAVSRGPAND